jgi:hypothetical protein
VTSPSVAIGGRLVRAGGEPQSGTITAKANEAIHLADGSLWTASPVAGRFDADGRIVSTVGWPLTLVANDAGGEAPTDSFYTFTLHTVGGFAEFRAVVSVAAVATDTQAFAPGAGLSVVYLGDLVAADTMVGHPITGIGIPPGATVLDLDPEANMLTISALTTADVSGATVGGTAHILDLLAAAL